MFIATACARPLADDDPRPLRAAAAVERALDVELRYQSTRRKGLVAVKDRARYLRRDERGGLPILVDGGEPLVSLYGVLVPPVLGPAGVEVMDVHCTLSEGV